MKLHFLPLSLALALTITSVRAQQRPVKPAPTPTKPQPTAAKPQPSLALPTAEPAASTAPLPPAPFPSETNDLGCRVLTGRVTNQLNQPLTGATVIVRLPNTKGLSIDPSITNAEGQYMVSSKLPIPRNAVLEISAGGYNVFALPLANCQPVEASLEPLPGTRFKNDGRIKKTSASGKIH
jgi:hypothetical protein